MKKTKIKSGYVVELRNGMRFNVTRVGIDKPISYLVNDTKKINLPLDYFDDDLRALTNNKTRKFDIERIWGFPNESKYAFDLLNIEGRKVLYERPQVQKMTQSEIEEKLGYKIEIVKEG